MVYVIIIIILILFIVFLIGTIKVFRFLYPKVYLQHGEIRPEVDYAAGETVPEKVIFNSTDDIPTTGLFYSCGKENAPCVIITHGYASRMGVYPQRTSALLKRGWHVFTFDFRGHGESEYPRTSLGLNEYRDIVGALDYLRNRDDIDAERIAIWGNSMGAVSAIKAIAHENNIKALIADSPFHNLVDNFNYRLKKKRFPFIAVLYMLFILGIIARANMFANNTARYLREFNNVPILFIHGDEDLDVEFEAGEKLFEIYNGPKEFFRMNGIGHYDHDDFDNYLEKSIEFLEENLK